MRVRLQYHKADKDMIEMYNESGEMLIAIFHEDNIEGHLFKDLKSLKDDDRYEYLIAEIEAQLNE